MNFNVSAAAIRNPIPVILLFLVLAIMGVYSYPRLGVDDNPDVDFPIIIVSVAQTGATPSELETDVTRKVEDSLVGIANLDHIISTVTEGSSTTTVAFKIGTHSDVALNDVRDAVSRIRQQLPLDVTEPVITHPTTSGQAFVTYSVGSDRRSVAELSQLIDQDITRSILAVPGVAQVQRFGGLTREIRVKLDPQRLEALGTTVQNVNLQLRALNLNLPGGEAQLGQGQQGIRTLGSVNSVEDLRGLPIILDTGATARLDTLGEVEDTYADIQQVARLDGKPVVAFGVVRSQGSPILQTEQATVAQVAQLQKNLPPDVHIQLIRSLADYTRGTFHASVDALIIGAVLAVIVIYAFLRNWQATVIAALAIPLSILPTFAAMLWLGYTLNGITMLGLTLVVGILVDDAIVDLENIHRHIAMGKDRMKAAFDATDEIGLAVIATTFTIVAVFGPMSFMEGIMGQFFRSFGITVVISVLLSLLVARTATPLLAAYMLPYGHQEHGEPFYRAFYMTWLKRAVTHRWTTLLIAIGIFIGSLMLTPFLSKSFFSAGDTGQVDVTIALPSGASVEKTDAVVQQATRVLLAHPGVKHVFAQVGSAVSNGLRPPSGAGGVSSATINVFMVPRKDRKFDLDQFCADVRPQLKAIPGARLDATPFGGVGSAKPVNVILRGDDPVALDRASRELLKEMRGMPQLQDVLDTAEELRPEVHIQPDVQRATQQGVSVQAIGQAVRLATQGDTEENLAKFNAGDQQIDILVQLQGQVMTDINALRNIMVPGRQGLVPLQSVASVTMGSGPVEIDRYDRARQVTFTANLTRGDLGSAMQAIQNLPIIRNLPPGVVMDTSGQSKFIADAFNGFITALFTGVMFIYVVLVLLFRGFMHPVTIMVALPLSFAGAFAGLLVFQKDLGLMAMIGIVMLMGLVTKNSILLVDYAIEARKRGLGRVDALVQAGHDRVRPILMTTIAMIAGMMPIALALGEGTERLSPMACAVIGGLMTSTLLTLFVVPSVYTIIDDIQGFIIKRLKRVADAAGGHAGAEAVVEEQPLPH